MISAIYARKSTDQSGVADAEKSVTRQIEHASDYAVGKGWTVAPEHIYSDDGISGAEFANRPGFLRLMNALKPTPPFQVLVMSEESRLGREAIETAYALKQLVTAGVRVFFYLEDRERTLDSPTDKIMLSLTTFADELEREKARQRTYDAMLRKARAGHVTGGRVFGYDNVRVNGHVERRINETESEVVRRIFDLSANGHGMKAIAKRLNAEGAPSPRAQQGRSQSWAPSSVRTVLFRDLYRGVITWNQTRKRNQWGQKQQTRRPEDEWVRIPAPHLMIVTDEVWEAAHARLDAARAVYLKGTGGQRFGRPPVGSSSKYLLTNLAQCGCCGSSLKVRTRSHRHFRAKFYGCSGYHDRGRTICSNGVDIPMEDANGIVLEALLDEVLTPDVLDESVEHALQILMGGEKQSEADRRRLEQQMRRVEGERERLVEAVATGGELGSLLSALRDRESRLDNLRAESEALRSRKQNARQLDGRRIAAELRELAKHWRDVLAGEPAHARPILTKLLVGRVSFTPLEDPKRWELRGQGTIVGLFQTILPLGMAPQRDEMSTSGYPRGSTSSAGCRV